MRVGKSFQVNKISRFIKTRGEQFTFERLKKNIYNEPIKDKKESVVVLGVYHEINSQVTETTTDGSVVRSKPQPRVLCMVEDGVKLKQDDVMEYKGTKYKVIEPVNPLKCDICADVSLEVIENGI